MFYAQVMSPKNITKRADHKVYLSINQIISECF